MTRRGKRRLQALALGMAGLGVATALALTAFKDNLVFFYSPSDVAQSLGVYDASAVTRATQDAEK